jgi:CHAD domain-containing protein
MLVHAEPTAEHFHGLRKRVKDRWYQVRVLEGIWPHPSESPEKTLGELQEDLGDDHNLDVLRGHVPAESGALRELLDRTQNTLREKSLKAAGEFYQRKPSEYVDELKALWDEWRPVPKGAKPSRPPARRAHSAA